MNVGWRCRQGNLSITQCRSVGTIIEEHRNEDLLSELHINLFCYKTRSDDKRDEKKTQNCNFNKVAVSACSESEPTRIAELCALATVRSSDGPLLSNLIQSHPKRSPAVANKDQSI